MEIGGGLSKLERWVFDFFLKIFKKIQLLTIKLIRFAKFGFLERGFT